jgi:MFS family permease
MSSPEGTPARIALAVGAGLALADASIVTLGLPSILSELGTTVEGVALVLAVYTAALALALPIMVLAARRFGASRLGAAGLLLFGAASLVCGLVDSLDPLLVLRGVQAVGGAAALVAAFDLLDGGTAGSGRRIWIAASVFGTAVGPALGGALTEAFDWRAIFLAQVPLVLPGAIVCISAARGSGALASADGGVEAGGLTERVSLRSAIALALLSAALTAVIFLVVLLLVAGWSIAPLAAALAVSVLPAAALASSRIGGDAELRAAGGCLLVGAGVGCLAMLPGSSPLWTIVPQALAGTGMGLALPALTGELLPERTRADAARLLSVRHTGITVALVVLAPIIASSLDRTIATAREEGTAALLDASIDPESKIELAPKLFDGFDTDDPRGKLERSVARARADLEDEEVRGQLDALADQLDEVVTGAVRSSFRIAFIVTAALALAAGLILLEGRLPRVRARAGRGAAAGALAAVAMVALYGVAFANSERERVRLQDPCNAEREDPGSGGIGGFLQDRVLESLDRAACEFGSSREELLLALFDDELRDQFEREHGEDPRQATELGPAIFGL